VIQCVYIYRLMGSNHDVNKKIVKSDRDMDTNLYQ
jgi:hypothetical protein